MWTAVGAEVGPGFSPEEGWGQGLDISAPLFFCLCMLSQLSLSEEELIAPKRRTPDPRDQEAKREMLEYMTTKTAEQK